ncbi:hypothetical protein HCN44_001788 [Aphidius gifuensis]|uniref:Uncharacterized protein n=1 Tax=Aphidius gifuensis TaxID=684658 RepID=A0A834XJE3_APHGI|nr:hypothetical protein HCN44_001788 [Aphidius gifuensis]
MSQKVLNKKKNWIPKKYQIIEWILPGPKPATRKVDIVPLDWIIVDSRAGKNIIKSYYPPHPYTDVDILIINGAEYDKSWPKPVSINVVGEASTYDEALIHWEKINEQKERAQHLTDFIQKSKIKDKEKEIAQKQKELLASQGRQKNTNKKKRGISILLDDDDNGSENLNIDEFNNQDIIKNINQNSYSKDEDSEIQANSSSETLKNQFGFSSSKILTCIGDCIMKASDWDNHRSLQKKKETKRLSLAEYIQNKNVNEEELHDDQ